MRDRLVHGYFTVDLEIAAINYFLEKKIVILNNFYYIWSAEGHQYPGFQIRVLRKTEILHAISNRE